MLIDFDVCFHSWGYKCKCTVCFEINKLIWDEILWKKSIYRCELEYINMIIDGSV